MAYLLADGETDGPADVTKNIASEDEVYVTFDLTFDPVGTKFYSDFVTVVLSDTTCFSLRWRSVSGPGWRDVCNGFGPDTTAPNPTGQLIETHFRRTSSLGANDGVTEVWLDGVLIWSGAIDYDAAVTQVVLGQGNNGGEDGVQIENLRIGTTRGGSDLYSDDFSSGTLTGFDASEGAVSVVPPLASHVGTASYEWRFVVTKLNLRVLTFLDRLARDKKVTYTLNKAATASGVVPSDDPEVYLVQSDGFPLIEEGVRCLLGFRQEGGSPRWVIRFAGIIETLEDNVDENGGVAPYSTFTAYDPRQLLYTRPIRDADGNHVGADGLSFDATPGNEIALALLERTFDADGEHFIDVDSGSIETTDAMDIQFQQGTSVGEALDQLTDTGNLDIVLTALYDPLGTPNKLAVFNAYSLVGSTRYKAVLAWDKPSRSLVGVNRLKDGTQRANRIRYTAGDGTVAGTESDFAAAVQYGDYWAQQTFPGKNVEAIELLAAEQLLLRAKGVKTYKLNPVPGSLGQVDAPLLFLDYNLGDVLPVYASSRLRHEIAVGKRVVSIPVNVADDGTERIEELELGEGEVEVS